MSLIEVAMALSMVSFGLLGAAKVITDCVMLEKHNRDSTVRHERARDLIEKLRDNAAQLLASRGLASDGGGGTGADLEEAPGISRMASFQEGGGEGGGGATDPLISDPNFEYEVLIPKWDPVSREYILDTEEFEWVENLVTRSSSSWTPGGDPDAGAKVLEYLVPVRIVVRWREGRTPRSLTRDFMIVGR